MGRPERPVVDRAFGTASSLLKNAFGALAACSVSSLLVMNEKRKIPAGC
jgi:hypothetical protein